MISLGIDLYVFINLLRREEVGENTIASAKALIILDSGQTLVGRININIDEDYSIGNSLEYFQKIIIHEFTHILGFSSSYFNALYKKEKNDDIFSRSQNFGNKKNVLRRINTNFSVNKDKYKKSIFNLDNNDFNKSQTNFHDKNKRISNTDFFRPTLFKDSYNNYNLTEVNPNNEEINNTINYNSIKNYDNNTPINNHRPIKLYKEKDNANTSWNV